MRNVGGCFVNDIRLKVLKRSDDTQESLFAAFNLCRIEIGVYSLSSGSFAIHIMGARLFV